MKNHFIEILSEKDPLLLEKYEKSRISAKPFLEKYQINFPDYTDHGISHADRITFLASELLKKEEIENLNSDEIYVLLMGCLLHDIGMGIAENKILECINLQTYDEFFKRNPTKTNIEFIREYHHELSYSFIKKEFKELGIPSEIYAEAIALIAKAHRKVELNNYDVYKIKFFVKTGSDFLCLPYLGCIIRIVDELDVTRNRISELVLKYHLPKNEISKIEIDKHRASLLVNFSGDTVIITAKCYNQYVYNALISLYNKIKQEIKYCQKVIRGIGEIDKKNYKLTIKRLKKNIEPIGFEPLDIGFSIDIENVFNHFISHSLYSDPIIAIRESIQNAIDTCRYKKSFTIDYNPIINIILENNKLIIEDNGIGMDYFIIKEFFGKLGNSYYKTPNLKTEFESIADFGIGIFSYFLICDFFEIETKMKDNVSIKFKVNKDPNLNFYFYKEFYKKEEGTIIHFYLDEKLKEELSYEYLIKNLKKVVKDIEFPIKIISEKKYEIIEKDDYSFLPQKEIESILNIPFIDKKHLLTLISEKIENENFKGIIGIWIPINKSGDLETKGFYKWLKSEDLKIHVSHKGIYVNSYTRLSILHYMMGRINILNKTELNLSRNNFIDMKLVIHVIKQFEFILIRKVIEKWKNVDINNKFLNFNSFCGSFIDDYNLKLFKDDPGFSNLFKELMYFKIYQDGEIKYINSRAFLSDFKKFLIIPITDIDSIKNLEFVNYIYKEKNIPILFTDYFMIEYHFFLLFNENTYFELSTRPFFPYLIATVKDKIVHRKNVDYYEIIKFKTNWIYARFTFKYHFLNENHPIIKFWIKNMQSINENNNLRELFKYFLENLKEIHWIPLEEINRILKKTNKILNTNFKLRNKDFPKWVLKKHIAGYLE